MGLYLVKILKVYFTSSGNPVPLSFLTRGNLENIFIFILL